MNNSGNFYIDIQGEYYQFDQEDILFDKKGHSSGFNPERVPEWIITAYDNKNLTIEYAYQLYLGLRYDGMNEAVSIGDYLIKGSFDDEIDYVPKTVFNQLAKPW